MESLLKPSEQKIPFDVRKNQVKYQAKKRRENAPKTFPLFFGP